MNAGGLGLNDKFVITFLSGVIFSSFNFPTFEDIEAPTDQFPHATLNTWLNLFGLLLGLISFVFPVVNYIRYKTIRGRIRTGAEICPGPCSFGVTE